MKSDKQIIRRFRVKNWWEKHRNKVYNLIEITLLIILLAEIGYIITR